MGQAAVDLPETDKAPAPLKSADDLLSQLAGAEIDRMLADSEQKGGDSAPGSNQPEPSEAQAATKPAQDAYAAEVDQLFKQLNKSQTDQEPAASGAPSALVDAVAPVTEPAQGIAADANSTEAAPAPDLPAVDPQPAQQNVSTVTPASIPPPVVAPNPQPVAVAAPAIETPVTVAEAIESAVKLVEKDRTSLLVRVLEWINAPLEWCPDVARELIGKLAILTLMNAMGVLLYVALFRK
jgi:hypothetical protein